MTGCVRIIVLAAGLLAAGAAQALDMSVFGDMSLSDSNAPSTESSFRLGSLDLYALQYIDDKTKALFETQFQTFSGDSNVDVEIQRFEVTREINDHFQIGLGRFHTPLGYWNTHYHHGILLQDTVTRPFFLGFEGNNPNALWPIHLVGVMAEGEIAHGFSYEAAIANSNNIDSSDEDSRLNIPNRTDFGPSKSIFGRLWYDAYGHPFKPGLFFVRNDVVDASPLAASGDPLPTCATVSPGQPCSLVERGEPLVKQTLAGADLRYESERFLFLSEFYWLQNDAQPGVGDGRTHSAVAYFTQFGYNFNKRLRATYRYESLDFDSEPGNQDPYFMDPRLIARQGIGTDERNVFCLRYDFSESNALMLEVSRTNPQLADSITTTILTWAFVMY
jgi:hypothetical protein